MSRRTAPEPEPEDPAVTVTDGRETLGHIFSDGRTTDANDTQLGIFKNRDQARAAIRAAAERARINQEVAR